MYLLDTNTLIYFFKGVGNVTENLFSHSSQDISVPSIVVYELYVWIAKSNAPEKRTKQLNELLDNITVVDFGEKEAASSAKVRAFLEERGTPIGPLDTLIAGTALANRSTLITHNTKEFSRVDQLNIEDWF